MSTRIKGCLLAVLLSVSPAVLAHDSSEEMRQLRQENQNLKDKMAELKRTIEVLQTEKYSRVESSSGLRGEVRKFIQDNIDTMKQFLVQGDLLDYIGSEQVSRSKSDKDGMPKLLVDFSNKVHGAGVLTAVGGYFYAPGTFSVKVLRPVGGKHVVVWESAPIHIASAGQQFVNFPVSVGVEGGDVIGYFFPGGVNVSYDQRTGDTRFQSDDVSMGGSVSYVFLEGVRENRAYSLGVYGMIE